MYKYGNNSEGPLYYLIPNTNYIVNRIPNQSTVRAVLHTPPSYDEHVSLSLRTMYVRPQVGTTDGTVVCLVGSLSGLWHHHETV